MSRLSLLWAAPEVNPITKKARSIPLLNPISVYGRVFFFSWFGFFIAFWSWYAFPPLLNDVIAEDIGLSKTQIAISNIIALTATLLVRLVAGTACDRFGPRYTFAGCLLIGAIPTFLSGTAYNVTELYALRFFIGILGGSFVPCQVWTTGFFDKNVVGRANSLTAGLGNAGGGVTYFLMPAVYKSLVKDGLSPHNAWRVAFVVPGIMIVSVAVAMVILCPDTPKGNWSQRSQVPEDPQESGQGNAIGVHDDVNDEHKDSETSSKRAESPVEGIANEDKKVDGAHEKSQIVQGEVLDIAKGEIIEKPSFREMFKVCSSPQTLVLGACYFCTFGAELSVNSVLGLYYDTKFPSLGLSGSGSWAAMFGLLNAVCRPLGGVVSDYAYKYTGSPWSKKLLLHGYSLLTGTFLIVQGVTDSPSLPQMVGLISGLAFFLEGANGMNYSLVPHVHPYANGVVSGFVGASGNLGGIIFACIFLEEGTNYGKAFWIIGTIVVSLNLALCWIRPVPRGQIGG